MPGITRVRITDEINGRGAYRFDQSRSHWGEANKLYRNIFEKLRTPLLPGEEEIRCTKIEAISRLDWQLGIDLFLGLAHGGTASVQEKFLFTTFDTITVEYMQDPEQKKEGDWFNMQCQYYFVAYDYPPEDGLFETWALLDWPRVQRATAQGRIAWFDRINGKDGAQASFKYTDMNRLPDDVVVDREPDPHRLMFICDYCGLAVPRLQDHDCPRQIDLF